MAQVTAEGFLPALLAPCYVLQDSLPELGPMASHFLLFFLVQVREVSHPEQGASGALIKFLDDSFGLFKVFPALVHLFPVFVVFSLRCDKGHELCICQEVVLVNIEIILLLLLGGVSSHCKQ